MKPIVAIDPGPEQSAYIVWHPESGMTAGMMRSNLDIAQLIRQGSFDDCGRMAIEMVACYGMPVGKETFETCLWIGRFVEAAWSRFLEGPAAQLVYRKDVKMHLCHSMRAKDGNIRQALIDKHGPPGTKKAPGKTYGISGHLWAALAVADYVAHLSGLNSIERAK